MNKQYIIFFILLMSINSLNAFTWEKCIERYDKAKLFSDNIRLSYNYLKSTKNCLVKFKKTLIQNPDSDFTVEAMTDNIVKIEKYINDLLPKYTFKKNNLQNVPKYLSINSTKLILNSEYKYFKKFSNCNGIHANNKIYTAKHCEIKNSKNLHFDLNYIKTDKVTNLKVSKLNINKTGTFKYYSMSKEGMFYNVLLKETNCKFYIAKNTLNGINKRLDYSDLVKRKEIRSNCLAIPSNSGGGVFQEGKLVGIISKAVFENQTFKYSIVEPIIHEKNFIEF